MSQYKDIKIGKYISYLLRHHPEDAGLTLDGHGYADVGELISGVKKKYESFTMEDLERITAENDKQRYAFNDDKTKIRANHGHTVQDIDLELSAAEPPAVMYHGTSEDTLEAIRKEGIKRMERKYVHISVDEKTALSVGQRHGKPVIIKIDAAAMYRDGYKFYRSENGIWLTDYVPPEYFI